RTSVVETGLAGCSSFYISECYLSPDAVDALNSLTNDRSAVDSADAGTPRGSNTQDSAVSGPTKNGSDTGDGAANKEVIVEDVILAGETMKTVSFCSRNGSANAGTNILQTQEVILKAFPLGTHYNKVLETNIDMAKVLRDDVVNLSMINGKVLGEVLNTLPTGPYVFQLCDVALRDSCTLNANWLEEILGDWEELEQSPKGTVGVAALVEIEDKKIVAHSAFGVLYPRTGAGTTHQCDEVNSPLVLDLTGSGIHLSAPLDGPRFDLLGYGSRQQISWPLGSNAAFLVLDRNRNGSIDDIHELFGNSTIGPDMKTSKNGFEALRKYDSNQDGLINAKDPVFAELKVWLDKNNDGKSNDTELRSLSQAAISWIQVNYVLTEQKDQYGNLLRERSEFATRDGTTGKEKTFSVVDVWFRTLPLYSAR
ncbi:MAG: hypothetical protein M3Q07_25505, partial [Pseudobdellovibrionaceae bacterium]|nr:hypothetical protein [Pseudobdellovibrionaceae bacterium]